MFTTTTRIRRALFAFDGDEPSGGDDKSPVPYERFKAERDRLTGAVGEEKQRAEEAETRAAKAETDLAAAKRDADVAQRQELPELERLKAENTDLTARLEALGSERDQAVHDRDQRIVGMERGGWVRDEAAKLGAHDPEDFIRRLDLNDLTTADAAAREVKAIAEGSPHLVKAEEKPTSTGDMLRQVLEGGRPKDEPGGEKDIIAADEFNGLSQDQHVALAEGQPDLYQRSLAAAAA